jgi:hypothetical protein
MIVEVVKATPNYKLITFEGLPYTILYNTPSTYRVDSLR